MNSCNRALINRSRAPLKTGGRSDAGASLGGAANPLSRKPLGAIKRVSASSAEPLGSIRSKSKRDRSRDRESDSDRNRDRDRSRDRDRDRSRKVASEFEFEDSEVKVTSDDNSTVETSRGGFEFGKGDKLTLDASASGAESDTGFASDSVKSGELAGVKSPSFTFGEAKTANLTSTAVSAAGSESTTVGGSTPMSQAATDAAGPPASPSFTFKDSIQKLDLADCAEVSNVTTSVNETTLAENLDSLPTGYLVLELVRRDILSRDSHLLSAHVAKYMFELSRFKELKSS